MKSYYNSKRLVVTQTTVTDSLCMGNDAGLAATNKIVEVPHFDAAVCSTAEHSTAAGL